MSTDEGLDDAARRARCQPTYAEMVEGWKQALALAEQRAQRCMDLQDQLDAMKAAQSGAPPLTPEGQETVEVLEPGSCPECGGDIMARADHERLFLDGSRAWCNDCGFQGQVTTDSETPAYFDFPPAPTQAQARTPSAASAPSSPEGQVACPDCGAAPTGECVLCGGDGRLASSTVAVLVERMRRAERATAP